MKRLLLCFLAGMLFSLAGYAQVPSSSFTIPSTACLQERIIPANASTNATSLQWDLCADDFQTLKNNISIGTVSGLSVGAGYKLVEDSGNWYAFIVSQNNHRVYRTDFGNSPLNVPIQTVDLGNPGSALLFPQDIEIYKANGKWYGFVGANDSGYGLVRLDFGASITSSPTATNLGTFGVSGRFWDVKVVEYNSNLVLVIDERNTGSIIRVNFRSSFDNAIVNASHVFVTSLITPNLSPGFDMVQVNGNWIALLTSYSDNKLYQISFGSDLFSSPTVQSSFSLPSFNKPTRIRMVTEGNRYVAVVSNESTAVAVVDLKDLNPANAPTIITQNGLPTFLGLDVERFNGKSLVIGVNGSNNTVRQLVFESDCGVASSFLTTTSPVITYSTSGNKVIELKAINSSSLASSLSAQAVTISSATAPDIDFSIVNSCINAPVNFTAINSSANITSYGWNFGDGNLATGNAPQNTYSTAATFPVTLQVSSSNGCNNNISKSHTIYNAPQASFTMPSASPFCTSQTYQFTNTSIFDGGSSPTWQWSVNGNNVSTTKDLSLSFVSNTSQQIQLTAAIPGCSTQSVQTINSLATGPLVNFTVGAACQSSAVTFTNNTIGTVTSYSWTFGDGNSSTQTNGQNTYATIGSYQVTLQANNAAGCQNSFSKSVTVYSKPQVDFSIGLPPFSCAGNPSQFTDASANPVDSNLSSWNWSFGDAANGTSTSRNPAYTYSTAASYLVSLTVGTNFGCSTTLQKSITISPSPVASFTNSTVCKDQVTQFTDASSGSIQSRLWQIQGNTITTPNPTYTFTASGSFSVVLTLTATNGCIAQSNKVIVVPVPPTLDFQVAKPCVNNATVFTEITNTADPAVSQAWVFGSVGSGTSTPVIFNFTTTSNYNVKLSSTRQSGCTYSITRAIAISDAPVAGFNPSVESGGAPLLVNFTNTSTGATSYTWKFGDQLASASTLVNPSFTYTSLGDYTVELSAFNSLACITKATSIISVVVPSIDLVMTDFYLSKDAQTGLLQPVVTIANKSNVTITDPSVVIELADGGSVRKQLTASIKPTKEITQMLDFQLIPQAITYVCAEVQAASDIDLFSNRKCVALNDQEIVLTPYPNPTTDTLTLDWISKSGAMVSVDIFNSAGTVVFQQNIAGVAAGLNRLSIGVDSLPAGLYFIRFSDSAITRSFKIAVSKK
ncbi:MAG: PKD domain-containing protein [Cyclobacteriaceae bacterium]|nr:PKD domain-containing protein [Cyclobacteriaceae bacterium]